MLLYKKSYYIKHPHSAIAEWQRKLKWFYQRGKRGYADRDVWSLDNYLNSWMPQAIRDLRDQDHGHPAGICDCEKDNWGLCSISIKDGCNGQEKWHSILNEIAEGFESAIKIQDKWLRKPSPEWEKFDKGMQLFHEHYFSLWD